MGGSCYCECTRGHSSISELKDPTVGFKKTNQKTI
jgi:hypothetical protein